MRQTTQPNLSTRRRGVVYGITVLDHHTRQPVPNDYIGQTRQPGRARENQHRGTQPFSDLIVGSPTVLWEGVCTDAELDVIEQRFIRELRPRLNWVHNEGNPDQIPKWIQKQQRQERDDAVGVPRWVPASDPRIPVRTARQHVVTGVLVAAWTLLTVLTWAWFDRFGAMGDYGPRWHGTAAATLATVLLVWGVRRPSARQRRRHR